MAKILVVDDEPDVEVLLRQRFRRRIKQGDLDFRFAGNGVEALQQLRTEPGFDLLLSDINMPFMDGLTLLRELREHNLVIKAVIISAYGDRASVKAAMDRGAIDFVSKPVDFSHLESTIDRTLGQDRDGRDGV
jgi:DNA-binding NtrC family response regulator